MYKQLDLKRWWWCHQPAERLTQDKGDMGGQIWIHQPTSSSPVPPPQPLPLSQGPQPNNGKIYDHPWSLLALFPWETTRSSCTDLQECPRAREPLLVGSHSSPLHHTSKYKTSGHGSKRGRPEDAESPVKILQAENSALFEKCKWLTKQSNGAMSSSIYIRMPTWNLRFVLS